jgi:hypothetical protein
MIADLVAKHRPHPCRQFDQIPMKSDHLALQAAYITPFIAGKNVAFIGDMDGTASYLGIQTSLGFPGPRKMLILDFDERVLEAANSLAKRFGFAELLELEPYNVFDPLPHRLRFSTDWFYTNPPYGSRNNGASARLFMARGFELTEPRLGHGCVIIPNQISRPWTLRARNATVKFFEENDWEVFEESIDVHGYHLDDDPGLMSSSLLIRRARESHIGTLPYAGRRVPMEEIAEFYGRSTKPPFPRYIGFDGKPIGDVAA